MSRKTGQSTDQTDDQASRTGMTVIVMPLVTRQGRAVIVRTDRRDTGAEVGVEIGKTERIRTGVREADRRKAAPDLQRCFSLVHSLS